MHDIYERGRCVESGHHEIFFSDRAEDLAAAQAICSGCEVRIPCLEVALEQSLEWGVWGGVVFWDGRAYHRKRGRGRPRRSEAHLPVEASVEELRERVRSA
jgi:WhiB family redox-sensing transcriptional regulator